jgi:pectin methylesterase-like acyl-CoA thioesterase
MLASARPVVVVLTVAWLACGGDKTPSRKSTDASAGSGGWLSDGSAGAGLAGAGGGVGGGESGRAGRDAGVTGSGDAAGGASAGSAGGLNDDGGTNAGRDGGADAATSAGRDGSVDSVHVDFPAGVTDMFPVPGSAEVCPDPVLRLTFAQTPSLGSAGKIQVRNSSGTVVASVDMAAAQVSETIGTKALTLPRRVYVEGRSAVIYLKPKALAYGQTYSVTVDAGAIRPGTSSFSLTGNTAWRFTTAAAAPAKTSALTVALDGSGDFCTVQGAADAVPANNTAATLITIKDGTYHEVVRVASKHALTLRGESRKGTVIRGVNNNNLNPNTSDRPLVAMSKTNDLTIENLTIRNDTPQGGSQAEALALNDCDRCVVRDADIISLQDTLLWSKRVYAKNCYIAGNVDYVWGTGTAYFDQCEIHTSGREGYVVQSRNGSGAYGYVFVDCKLTADAGISGDILARIDVSKYPASHVAYVNCQMGSHISPQGWTITGGSPTSALRFWEYQSKDANGKLIDVSRRAAGSSQISAAQAASMRDVKTVLGGWAPSL